MADLPTNRKLTWLLALFFALFFASVYPKITKKTVCFMTTLNHNDP